MRRVRRNRTRRVEGEFGPACRSGVLATDIAIYGKAAFLARHCRWRIVACSRSLAFRGSSDPHTFRNVLRARLPSLSQGRLAGHAKQITLLSQTRTVRQSRKEPAASVPTPP